MSLEQVYKANKYIGAGSHILGDKEPCWVGDLNDDHSAERRQLDGSEKEPGDEDFILYPPRFLGYSTKEKMWGQFSVDQTLDAPGKQPSMFKKQLQLEDKYKQMIQALVDEHEGRVQKSPSDRALVRDIVQDKGKGLVLLFHGKLIVNSLCQKSDVIRSSWCRKNSKSYLICYASDSLALVIVLVGSSLG